MFLDQSPLPQINWDNKQLIQYIVKDINQQIQISNLKKTHIIIF